MPRIATLDPEGTMPGCIHGWARSLEALDGDGDVVSSQMGLLNHAKLARCDEVRIAQRDGLVVLIRRDGGWLNVESDETLRRVPNNLLTGWRMGTLKAIPYDRPVAHESEYMGTPIECEAWLRRQFDIHRNYLRGATSNLEDGEYVPTDETAESLETYDRTVWELVLRSTDSMAKARIRSDPMTIETCGRIDNERELYDIAINGETSER